MRGLGRGGACGTSLALRFRSVHHLAHAFSPFTDSPGRRPALFSRRLLSQHTTHRPVLQWFGRFFQTSFKPISHFGIVTVVDFIFHGMTCGPGYATDGLRFRPIQHHAAKKPYQNHRRRQYGNQAPVDASSKLMQRFFYQSHPLAENPDQQKRQYRQAQQHRLR